MAKTISKIKIKQEADKFGFSDSSAVKKIYFNNTEYAPDEEGVVEIQDSLKEELKVVKILVKKICDYGSSYVPEENGFYVVRETENQKFSGSSLFVYDGQKMIRLTTPSLLFETEDIDFGNVLHGSYPKFLTWSDFCMNNLFTSSKKLVGKDVFGNKINDVGSNETHLVYFSKQEFDGDTYITTPYIVYKKIEDGETYYIKHYVDENLDGSLTLLEGKGTYCSNNSEARKRSDFVKSIDKI